MAVILRRPFKPNVPKYIGGLQLWLDATLSRLWTTTARTTPAVANADPVGVWEDLSGLGNDVQQATAGDRPVLNTNALNGRQVIGFVSSDGLSLSSISLPNVRTSIVVARATGGASGFALSMGNAAATGGIAQHLFVVGSTKYVLQGGLADIDPAWSYATSTWQMATYAQNGPSNNASYALNGNSYTLATGLTTVSFSTQPLAVGISNAGTVPLIGQIAAIYIWNKVLSAAELALMQSYVRNLYGIF